MSDPVKVLLRFVYYYARLLGVYNFEIDLKAGRAKLTNLTSVYAAFLNVLIICGLPFLSSSELIEPLVSRSGKVHNYIFGLMMSGHILSVTMTLIMHWWQRQQVIRIVNSLIHLLKRKPKIMQMWRPAILTKFFSIILTEINAFIMTAHIIWNCLKPSLIFNLLLIFVLLVLNNIIISHYYFALLNIQKHYNLLNEELHTLLVDIGALESEHRKGVLAIKCCSLADRLESIARKQSQLQKIVESIAGIYGLQILFISLSVYMTSVCVIYFLFSQLPGTTISLTWSNWMLTTHLFIEFVLYFIDTFITINMTCSVLTANKEMENILSIRTEFGPGIDKRLEAVLDNFKIQLAFNPLNISVLGLYHMDKTITLAMISSAVSSSLVLVQYDLQNS